MAAVLVTARASCYAEVTELAVSSLQIAAAVPVLIAPVHGGMARLSLPGWLIKYQDGVNATRIRERSPIPVLTGSGVEQLR